VQDVRDPGREIFNQLTLIR